MAASKKKAKRKAAKRKSAASSLFASRTGSSKKTAAKKRTYKAATALTKTGKISVIGHRPQISVGRTVNVTSAEKIYGTLGIDKEMIRAARRAIS